MSNRYKKMKDNFFDIYCMIGTEEKITEDYYKRYLKTSDNPNHVEYDPLIHGWRGEEPRRNWVPPVTSQPRRAPVVIPMTPLRTSAEDTEDGSADVGSQLLGDGSSTNPRPSKFSVFRLSCFHKK